MTALWPWLQPAAADEPVATPVENLKEMCAHGSKGDHLFRHDQPIEVYRYLLSLPKREARMHAEFAAVSALVHDVEVTVLSRPPNEGFMLIAEAVAGERKDCDEIAKEILP